MSNRKKWTIALCASIFVNLILGGYILGRESNVFTPSTAKVTMDPSFGFPRLLRALPEDRVHELMDSIKNETHKLRREYRIVASAQSEFYKALISESFSSEKLRETSDKYASVLQKSRESSNEIFLILVDQLTPEERKLLVSSAHREWKRVPRESNNSDRPSRSSRESRPMRE